MKIHCRNPVDVVNEESELSGVDCPSPGTHCGYMSPEQAQGEAHQTDGRSAIYL